MLALLNKTVEIYKFLTEIVLRSTIMIDTHFQEMKKCQRDKS